MPERRDRTEYSRAYYEAHKEAIQERQRAYYEAHKDRILARNQTYKEANRDRLAQKQRQYDIEKRQRAYKSRGLTRAERVAEIQRKYAGEGGIA